MSLTDVAGTVGVVLILLAYSLLQMGRLQPRQLSYSMLNALGALLILVSLTVDFNLSAVLMEGAWLVISLIGIVHALRSRPADHG